MKRLADLLPGVVADLATHHTQNRSTTMTDTELPKPYDQARQLTRDNIRGLWEWIDGKAYYEPDMSISGLTVFTPGGRVKASFGDWIIRGREGRFYACKPEVFAALYGNPNGAA